MEADADADADQSEESFEPAYATDRQTAPQSPYTQRDVVVGALIALIGVLVTFAIPLAFA